MHTCTTLSQHMSAAVCLEEIMHIITASFLRRNYAVIMCIIYCIQSLSHQAPSTKD